MSDQHIFTHDAFPVIAPVAPRFTPGARLPTPEGCREVETLAVGDLLTTRSGPKRIARLEVTRRLRGEWAYARDTWPVRVPVGSLGNIRPMRLSPDQRVLLSGGTIKRICNVAEISVSIRDLVGLRGVMVERPLADLRYFGLSFGIPAVIEAGGVVCEIEQGDAAVVSCDMARHAFQTMHAVGEPPLKR
ncbi:Hint domain-containing protein [Jannaschia faecimaris]|uniref:Hint domain-containing protein n=1 Tax=Jannaschia faecimaris TaxID=1244108 RepID=A0A1H3NR80_9RHOB|nr:Hint domain-containing protein [Jannaschia faecimaris]SDY91263.1 Hint domain-containing protein [Jannaschia faecimaris]